MAATALAAPPANVNPYPVRPSPADGIARMQQTGWSVNEEAPADIWALAQSADGYLWLGTGSGLYRFDGLEFVPYPLGIAHADESNNITALLIADDGCVWVGYFTGGASVICGNQVQHFGRKSGAPAGMVFNFAQDRNGRIWMATNEGFGYFQGDKWHAADAKVGYPSNRADWVLCDRAGTLWVATGQGVVRKVSNQPTFAVGETVGGTLSCPAHSTVK